MGYYIYVQCVSQESMERMLTFLDRNHRGIIEFVPDAEPGVGPPRPGKLVCTYAKPKQLGWYKNAGWSEQDQIYADNLLRWMALKVGATLGFSDIPGIDHTVNLPWTGYDSDIIAVVKKSDWPSVPDSWTGGDGEYAWCDDLGFDPSIRPFPEGVEEDKSHYTYDLRLEKEQADKFVRAELERLDALWARS